MSGSSRLSHAVRAPTPVHRQQYTLQVESCSDCTMFYYAILQQIKTERLKTDSLQIMYTSTVHSHIAHTTGWTQLKNTKMDRYSHEERQYSIVEKSKKPCCIPIVRCHNFKRELYEKTSTSSKEKRHIHEWEVVIRLHNSVSDVKHSTTEGYSKNFCGSYREETYYIKGGAEIASYSYRGERSVSEKRKALLFAAAIRWV